MRHYWNVFVALLLGAVPLTADSPAPAARFSVFSTDKTVRVDSTPKDLFGSRGKTEVFDVSQREKRLYRFNWYADGLLVERTASGVALVRFGGWPGGQKASHRALAFEFYLGDKLLKSYSTLDIAGDSNNVISSVSHHMYSQGEAKVRHNSARNRFEFTVETIDGRLLTFDIETGEIVSRSEKFSGVRESAWFKENVAWARDLQPKPVADRDGPRSNAFEKYRAIWVGAVDNRSNKPETWSVQLSAPVQLEPRTVRPHTMHLYCTNGIPVPGTGEVWAFAGTVSGPFMVVKSAKRFPEFEGDSDARTQRSQ